MAADHQLEPGQPDRHADVLASAIAALRAVLQPHFREPADLDEVVQSACVRLVQAIHKAGTVDSPTAFLHSVWREERAMLLRERARRQRLGEAGDLPVEELALAAAEDGFTEEEIRSIGAALPGSLGAWFLDHVSGRSDEDLAARDGVTTAAIRQRWRQLRGYFLAEGVLPKILDFLLTNRGSRASIGLRPPEIGSPPTPNPGRSPMIARSFGLLVFPLSALAILLPGWHHYDPCRMVYAPDAGWPYPYECVGNCMGGADCHIVGTPSLPEGAL